MNGLSVAALLLVQVSASAPVIVVFQTELGAITLEVDVARAPVTAANFLKYVDGKFFDGGVVNRSVRPDNTARKDVEIQIIQFQSDAAGGRAAPLNFDRLVPIPTDGNPLDLGTDMVTLGISQHQLRTAGDDERLVRYTAPATLGSEPSVV